ncbi:ACSM3 [Cordylochernes scorpioides]|uniref:medium-chain acyl-CoA ligase n=1 Tax=Cordylochernes scorpioides TaxID=51811 RepID=A0ABY6JZE0_9ARAC|nr:ACSM3 [Cordylochernes scorpioides]
MTIKRAVFEVSVPPAVVPLAIATLLLFWVQLQRESNGSQDSCVHLSIEKEKPDTKNPRFNVEIFQSPGQPWNLETRQMLLRRVDEGPDKLRGFLDLLESYGQEVLVCHEGLAWQVLLHGGSSVLQAADGGGDLCCGDLSGSGVVLFEDERGRRPSDEFRRGIGTTRHCARTKVVLYSLFRENPKTMFSKRYLQDGVIQPPQFFNFASDVVDEWARLESVGRRPSRFPALWYVSESGKELKWSFKDVSEMSMKTANVLQKECCQERNDKIMVVLPKTPEWWLVKLAASRIGACFSPGTSQLSTKDLEYRLAQYEATCVITDSKTAIKIDEISTRIPSLRSKVLVDPTMSIERNGWINLNQRLLKVNPRHECGERIDVQLLEEWEKRTNIQIRIRYGQTEMLTLCNQRRDSEYIPGSMGKPFPGIHLVVIDEDLNEVKPNEEGQIAIKIDMYRPVTLCKEYLKNPCRTKESFQKDYYLSGDRGYVDEEGYFWFVGRNDDVISSAGYRIGPSEVEEAINTHPAVAESAVVSSPDPERGEVVKAFVILRPEYKEQPQDLVKQLQDHVKSLTAPYKYPRKVEFVDSLPKTISGKVQRSALRKMEWERSKS